MNKALYFIAIMMVWASSVLAQIHLFRPEMKEPERIFVYDFLEHYLGEVSALRNFSEVNQKMAADKVYFVEGSVVDISRLHDAIFFQLDCFDEKVYDATWILPDQSQVIIDFPVNFELLLGMPKNEIEKLLSAELQHYDEKLPIELPDPAHLTLLDNGLYRTATSGHYYIEELSDSRYYSFDGTDFRPVFSPDYAAESLANLFLLNLGRDFQLDIVQNLYGFKNQRYSIRLSQWLAYCAKYEMHVYVAIEEEYEKEHKLLVVAECRMLGFNHMLSVKAPRDLFDHPDQPLRCQLNAYIPTHNVKELYQQVEAKDSLHRKIQIH